VLPLDYYTLLLFHVGGDEATTHSPKAIKRHFRALGQLVRVPSAQVIFSSILPAAGTYMGKTDGPILLIHGSMAGVTTRTLWVLIIG